MAGRRLSPRRRSRPRRGARSTPGRRASRWPDPVSDADAAGGVEAVLAGDDPFDPPGGLLDLAGLVRDDLVVVTLARQLERGVALAELELVSSLRAARPEPREERLHRGWDDEDQKRLADLFLHLLVNLDVDLEDRVPP